MVSVETGNHFTFLQYQPEGGCWWNRRNKEQTKDIFWKELTQNKRKLSFKDNSWTLKYLHIIKNDSPNIQRLSSLNWKLKT